MAADPQPITAKEPQPPRKAVTPRALWPLRALIVVLEGSGMLAVPSRASQRLPHLTAHDIAEIDAEVRDVLTKMSGRAALP